ESWNQTSDVVVRQAGGTGCFAGFACIICWSHGADFLRYFEVNLQASTSSLSGRLQCSHSEAISQVRNQGGGQSL
ncbi:hypothetical protein T265_08161, partial [Opisthorchis viverrini]